MDSLAVRAENRIDIHMKEVPSGDGHFKKTFRKVNNKAQVDSFMKRYMLAFILINREAGAAHIILNDEWQSNAGLVSADKEKEVVQVREDIDIFPSSIHH